MGRCNENNQIIFRNWPCLSNTFEIVSSKPLISWLFPGAGWLVPRPDHFGSWDAVSAQANIITLQWRDWKGFKLWTKTSHALAEQCVAQAPSKCERQKSEKEDCGVSMFVYSTTFRKVFSMQRIGLVAKALPFCLQIYIYIYKYCFFLPLSPHASPWSTPTEHIHSELLKSRLLFDFHTQTITQSHAHKKHTYNAYINVDNIW